jgi:hypothetical protein
MMVRNGHPFLCTPKSRLGLIVSAWLFFFTGCCPALAKLNGWTIDQTSDYFGKAKAFVTEKGVVMSADKFGISFVMQAPKWEITGYNEKSKVYSQTTRNEWQHEFSPDASVQKVVPVKGASETMSGVKVTKYYVDNAYRGRLHVVQGQVKEATFRGHTYNTVCWVCDEVGAPQPFIDFLGQAFQLPVGVGFPMKVIEIGKDGKVVTSLNTTLVKHTSFEPNVFALRKGYKRADNEMEVLVSGEDNDLDFLFAGRASARPKSAGGKSGSTRAQGNPVADLSTRGSKASGWNASAATLTRNGSPGNPPEVSGKGSNNAPKALGQTGNASAKPKNKQ